MTDDENVREKPIYVSELDMLRVFHDIIKQIIAFEQEIKRSPNDHPMIRARKKRIKELRERLESLKSSN